MLKKLPKNIADVKFINPDTMEVECTYNQCFKKFVEAQEYVIKTPNWNGYKPIKHKKYFHMCTKCGRCYASSEDKGKTIRDYESGFFEDTLTSEDVKKVLKQLKKIYEATTDPTKKKQVAEVFKSYKGKLPNE